MSEQRIMYCCTFCADNNSEMCGYFGRDDLRVAPDGRWLCNSCFDDEIFEMRRDEDDDRTWSDFPQPPEYGPLPDDAAQIPPLISLAALEWLVKHHYISEADAEELKTDYMVTASAQDAIDRDTIATLTQQVLSYQEQLADKADLREAIVMAENRLEAALIGDEVCKDCVELARSYLTDTLAGSVALSSTPRATPEVEPITNPLPRPPTFAVTSAHSLCAKCGCETKGEAALVDGKIWCHPCADMVPSTLRGSGK